MATKIYAYNPGSQSARALAGALGVRVLRREGSRYRPRPGDTIINWGASRFPNFGGARVLNQPDFVHQISNKLTFIRDVAQHYRDYGNPDAFRIPEWTEDKEEAREWIEEGHKVVARTVLNGHSGAGIHILEKGLDFVDAPLYTKYVPKKDEYRLHFVGGELIDTQRKAKRADATVANYQVRNLANGFVYVRGGVDVPPDVVEQSRRAFRLSGLDFGACDCIWNEKRGEAYVLEINTAPGLAGTTLEKYAEALKGIIN